MKIFYFVLIAVITVFCLPVRAATYYMTPEGAGDKSGSSWENAKASPTGAITLISDDIYYLKVGTYEFSNITTEKSHFFQITSDVSNVLIEGGFTGDGLEKSTTEFTILNGDNVKNNDRRFLQVNDKVLTNVAVKGIVFQNRNSASDSQGGAVLTRPGISFEDCVFKNNATAHTSTNQTSGVAVCISESKAGTVNFRRCQFIGNTASTSATSTGAAIGVGALSSSSNVLTVNIDNCLFDGNSAYNGGAIYVKLAIHQVNITNCTFLNNYSSASGSGGAIYVQGGTTTISNSIFLNNKKGTEDDNIYGTVAKSKNLEILSPLGLTVDLSNYPNGVPSSEQLSIPYTINTNYTVPVTASVNNGTPEEANLPYVITVDENKTLALAATPEIPVTITEGTHNNASISGLTGSGMANSTTYPISGTVTADANHHSPYLSINGVYVPVASDGSFTYTANLTSETSFTVIATAYAENILPVSEDTYVNGSNSSENNYTKTQIIVGVGSSSAAFTRRSYLHFDIPTAISSGNYNQAELQLVANVGQNKSGYSRMLIKTVPETLPKVSEMTWAANGEQYGTTFGDVVSPVNAYANKEPAQGTVTTFDCGNVLQYAVDNSLSLQIATLAYGTNHETDESQSNDATIYFNSLENGNASYVPQLVFSYKAPTSLMEINADDAQIRYFNLQGVEVLYPAKGGVYIVKQGAEVKKIIYQ